MAKTHDLVEANVPLLELRGVSRHYDPGPTALERIDLTLHRGEAVAIVGRSGSGKSTLLNILGMLDVPSAGELLIDGDRISTETDRVRSARRAADLGFVFQRSHLIGSLSARENVLLGLRYAGIGEHDAQLLADQSLRAVGLGDKLTAVARTLSGGEMQRVAIARTLARPAKIWLADEPTGNLDSARSQDIINLLKAAAETRGACLVVVTHEPDIAQQMTRIITLNDGVIENDQPNVPPASARERVETFGVLDTASEIHPTLQAKEPTKLSVDLERINVLGARRTSRRRRSGRARRTVRFVFQGVIAHPKRTLSGIVAAALAVALTLTAIGLAQSASAQVTSMFDAQRAAQVTAQITIAPEDPPRWPLTIERVEQYAGVTAVEYWHERASIPMTNGHVQADTATVIELDTAPGEATNSTIMWAANHQQSLGPGEVILGAGLAKRLGVGMLDLQPEITIHGHLLRVVGILTDSRVGTARGAAFLSTGTLDALGPATSRVVYVTTTPGAARALADNLRLLVDPFESANIIIDPVLSADAFRGTLQSSVTASLRLLAGLAGLAGLIAVIFVNVLSVGSRTAEFGVRRAFGARRRELVTLVLGETTLLGVLGAALGLAFGFITIMTVTAVARWQPVFDPRLLAIPLAGAIILGTLGGLAPAILAGRIQPADAVRDA